MEESDCVLLNLLCRRVRQRFSDQLRSDHQKLTPRQDLAMKFCVARDYVKTSSVFVVFGHSECLVKGKGLKLRKKSAADQKNFPKFSSLSQNFFSFFSSKTAPRKIKPLTSGRSPKKIADGKNNKCKKSIQTHQKPTGTDLGPDFDFSRGK